MVEIHIEDYIKDPRRCVLEICNALEVPCPQDYVEECYQKAYRNVSRSRDLIEWEPVILRRIQERMKEFPFFRGSDCNTCCIIIILKHTLAHPCCR